MTTFRVIKEAPHHQFHTGDLITPVGPDHPARGFMNEMAEALGMTAALASRGAQPYTRESDGQVQILDSDDVVEADAGDTAPTGTTIH